MRADTTIIRKSLHLCMLGASLWLTACTGLFDDIYDDPADQPLPTPEVETDSTETTISGTLYIDASDWEQWYYVDLQALADSVLQGQTTGNAVVCSAIPMTATGHEDHRSGIYTYWYDVSSPPTSSPNPTSGRLPCTATMCAPTAAPPAPPTSPT